MGKRSRSTAPLTLKALRQSANPIKTTRKLPPSRCRTGSKKLTPAAYTNEDKTATITTTGEVAADGNDLVLKIDGVKYNLTLSVGEELAPSKNNGRDGYIDEYAFADATIVSVNSK